MRRFWNDRSGNFAIMTGLMSIPLLVVAGGAIDMSLAYSRKVTLQSAVDSAVLVGARSLPDEAKAKQEAERHLRINYPHEIFTATFDVSGGTITGTATAAISHKFLHLIDLDGTTIGAKSAAARDGGGMELVLVLDVSGSMKSEISSLRSASAALVESIYGEETYLDNVYVGVVPFSGRVNVVDDGADWVVESEIDPKTGKPKHKGKRHDKGRERGPGGGPHGKGGGKGGKTKTANVGFECKIAEETEDYPRLCTGSRSGMNNENAATHLTELFGEYTGDFSACPVPKAVGLTSDRITVDESIAGLCSGHGTSTHIGMAWGWRMISPQWRGEWGDDTLPMSAQETPGKYVVIMTDGKNQPGQAGESIGTQEADAQLLRECTSMKAEGITIFAVTFKMGGELTSLYQQCASKPDYQFDAENGADLQMVFSDIGSTIADGSLRLLY